MESVSRCNQTSGVLCLKPVLQFLCPNNKEINDDNGDGDDSKSHRDVDMQLVFRVSSTFF